MRLTKLTLFFTPVLLLLIWGCSTTNHATLPKQAFYDITSHYNAYFNANEKLRNSLKIAQESHKDKFDSVISVYYYNDSKEFAAYSSDMDDIIKRSTLAVQLRGASNWSDDHFLLIGIANYLKGDYDKASSSFKYITTEYKEGVDYVKVMKSLGKKVGKYVKKKKRVVKPEIKVITNTDGTRTLEKIDNRPAFSLWIHEPARSEALIWLIKTYSRQNQFDEASTVVTYVRGDDLFFRNLDPELDLAEADLRVSQKDYAAAITPLEKYLDARKIKRKKRLRVRPLFVLAQCYEVTGNHKKAIDNYKLVLKSRPNYDMEFYAKLKMAKLARTGSSDNKEIRSLLAKMARDKKYSDYWDQVYYELALLSIAENQRDEARKLLHKSVDASTTNDDQKALSFLKLAELDYEDEQYVSSKYFYDSTLTFMAKNDSRYFDIEDRDRVLSNLVTQLDIIATEDSLQKLAAMPKEERNKAIRNAIAKKEKEEEDKKDGIQSGNQFQFNDPNQNQQNNTQQNILSGLNLSWYFYNTVARASGYNDFVKKWGRRKLEENWRRKNKSSIVADEDALVDTSATNTDKDTNADADAGTIEEQMEAGIPASPEKLEASNAKLIDAYYTAGTIYKDGLESYPKAENMFETLNARFPQNKLLLESYYNLYLIASRQKQTARAEEYKGKILSEFPESVIAKVLRNPDYINEAKRKEQEVYDYYQSAYYDYVNDSLNSAWYKTEMADNLFKPNPISAKFQLLGAMILAKQNRLADYVQVLNKIINRTTDAEVKKTATDLLTALNKSSLPQVDLSLDPARRDSLNAVFIKPDTSQNQLLQQLNQAKEQARQSGVEVKEVKVDTTALNKGETEVTEAAPDTSKNISVAPMDAKSQVVEEDTTSPYTRSDVAVHYFIIYIKDPSTPQSSVMSTMAKVDAFNSTQFETKRLVSKQVVIDSKNKLINVRQFKNRQDVMEYFNLIKTQSQLFSDLQPQQFAISAISIINFSTLLSEKDIDEYNKFFKRIYQ